MTANLKVAALAGVLVAVATVLFLVQLPTPPEAGEPPISTPSPPMTAQVNAGEGAAAVPGAERRGIEPVTEQVAVTGSLIVTVVYADDSSIAADVGLEVRPAGYRDPVPGPILVRTDEGGVARLESLPPGRWNV